MNLAAATPGLTAASPPPAWPGFRRLAVTGIEHESDSVISIRLEDPDGASLPSPRPGQYLTLRIQPEPEERSVLRNYSLSGPPDAGYYRITVKREHDGAASGYLHTGLRVGDQLDIAAPRGTFILDQTDAAVLLISAGIGATPMLAMLHALAEKHSEREIWWLHGARSRRDHSFAAEARGLLASLPNVHAYVYYSRPGREDREGRDFDSVGRLIRPCSPRSNHYDAQRTSAARNRSWTRSAPASPRSGSTRATSTPRPSDPHQV